MLSSQVLLVFLIYHYVFEFNMHISCRMHQITVVMGGCIPLSKRCKTGNLTNERWIQWSKNEMNDSNELEDLSAQFSVSAWQLPPCPRIRHGFFTWHRKTREYTKRRIAKVIRILMMAEVRVLRLWSEMWHHVIFLISTKLRCFHSSEI
jgi:hypothetical protein